MSWMPSPFQVITADEDIHSGTVGRERRRQALAGRRAAPQSYDKIPGTQQEQCLWNINGVRGEYSVARYLGIPDFIPSIGTFKKVPDVGPYDVRTVDLQSKCLLIYHGDVNRPVISVCHEDYGKWGYVRGWFWARDAKMHKEWYKPGRRPGAPWGWWVPPYDLRPMIELPFVSWFIPKYKGHQNWKNFNWIPYYQRTSEEAVKRSQERLVISADLKAESIGMCE